MENIETIAQLIERSRIEHIIKSILCVSIFCIPTMLVLLFLIAFVTWKIGQKIFSTSVKKQIFKTITKFKISDNIEIINYSQTAENYQELLKKYFDFDLYTEEDVLTLKIKNAEILMSEIRLLKKVEENRQISYTNSLAGVIYKIPKKYYTGKILDNSKIIQESEYVCIIKPQNKELFEISLLKKLNFQNITKFFEEIIQNIQYVMNYIQSGKNL